MKNQRNSSFKNFLFRLKQFFSSSKNNIKKYGTIKFFDRKKRFGFIIADGREYFFHVSATKPRDFKALRDGAAVKFDVKQGKKGPQANHVEII